MSTAGPRDVLTHSVVEMSGEAVAEVGREVEVDFGRLVVVGSGMSRFGLYKV